MDIVTMEHVTKVYGEGDSRVWGLHDVSLTIQQGEVVSIVGASGAINLASHHGWCGQSHQRKGCGRRKGYYEAE